MMIACTQGELVVVDILGTHAPLHLLKLLLEASGGIAEALEDTADAGDVAVLAAHAVLIVAVGLVHLLSRHGGHHELVGIGREGEAVPLVDGHHERGTETQVGRDELTFLVAIVGNLAAYVAGHESQS